jgi:predicted DNA-binding protein (MmcQ/YjbR family)
MTADEYRKMALGFPESTEDAHMDHPDFRVKGKIFATLGPGEEWGALKLTPEQQEFLIRADRAVSSPRMAPGESADIRSSP